MQRDIEIGNSEKNDRRMTQRAIVRCDCWLECDEITIYGFTANLGMSGFFLQTAIPVTPGRQFDIKLYLDRSPQPIVASGLVVRSILARSNAQYGVGVKFLSITSGRDALLSFISDQSLKN